MDRLIVRVAFTPVSAPAGLRKAVGGFLRYVQYRDRHPGAEQGTDERVSGELRYAAHRDRAASGGRLFDAAGEAGDEERRRLAAYVSRSVKESRPALWRDAGGAFHDSRRALYRFILSPEHAAGLDLRDLTGAAMRQLELDSGGPLRWIAAEHRNTAHPHVHLLVAGVRQAADGRYHAVVLTRERLQRMKEASRLELERQRSHRPRPLGIEAEPRGAAGPVRQRGGRKRNALSGRPARSGGHGRGAALNPALAAGLRRLANRYRRELELEAALREREERSRD